MKRTRLLLFLTVITIVAFCVSTGGQQYMSAARFLVRELFRQMF